MARKHNYLNNKDILKEIHKSKSTYCIYRDKTTDTDFDIILDSVDDIAGDGVSISSETHPAAKWSATINKGVRVPGRAGTKFATILSHGSYKNNLDEHLSPLSEVGQVLSIVPNIIIAKDNKAKRLSKAAYDAAVLAGEKVKQIDFAIDPANYTLQDLVFRINTFEHIPLAPPKVSKTKAKRKKIVETELLVDLDIDDDLTDTSEKIKYTRVNFPPFYHFRYTDGDELIQVAKSHWDGSYDNGAFTGEFCISHGNMTQKLALMFMKLCERYATKGNWRGYTYNDEMRGQALLQLSVIGLQFNEHKSQNPFAYYTAVVNNAFRRVLNIEKRNQVIRDDILEVNDFSPSYSRQNEHDMARIEKQDSSSHGEVIDIDPESGVRTNLGILPDKSKIRASAKSAAAKKAAAASAAAAKKVATTKS